MMNTLTNATANTSSSMLQMKLLQQLPDILTAPLSAMEISIAYIIGGTVRGTVNGVLVMILGIVLIDMPVHSPISTVCFIVMVSWAFASMGLVLGQLSDSWDQLAMMQNFFLTPLSRKPTSLRVSWRGICLNHTPPPPPRARARATAPPGRG